jgi:hypothetical protein
VAQTAILVLTIVHVGAGLLCLLLGPVAFLSAKGRARHRGAGLLYLRLMIVMAASAFLLLTLRFNAFFFVLATFSFYLAFSGFSGAATQASGPRPAREAAGLGDGGARDSRRDRLHRTASAGETGRGFGLCGLDARRDGGDGDV